MGLPRIDIQFKTLAATAIKRSERGTVALILEDDTSYSNPIEMDGINDIPKDLSDTNKEQIQLAFMGGVKSPRKVIAYIIPENAEGASADYTEAQNYLETIIWDYLAVPQIKSSDVMAMATWVKGLRDNKNMEVKAVLPNCKADHEAVINCTAQKIITAAADTYDSGSGYDGGSKYGKEYTAADYCSRIAGIAAGCPLTMSITFQVLSEVTDVLPHMTVEECDEAIDNGELILINDGEKVKIARGVNSLTTISADKGEDWQKIAIVDKMDLWKRDVTRTIADNYIGKYNNTYANKRLLIAAVQAYNDSLTAEGVLDDSLPEYNNVTIDIEAQRLFLESMGVKVDDMDEQQIKEANTKSSVFITSNPKYLDAMEDMKISVAM
jgi:hypothetical protein